MANENTAQNQEKPLVEIGNMSTVDVAHFGTDDDPTAAKAAGGLVNSDEVGPQEDAGNRPGAIGALGAGGGGSNAGPAREGDSEGDDPELV